ncbi:DNA-directed DNA polymerase [Verrucomicrobia bacterium]|nr:DNA-directed DNA polymerase [Verrucomicrobiota bacterium]
MAFKDFPKQAQGVQLLQRSLKRGRLGHAYLFTGVQLEILENLARTLLKTLNCRQPLREGGTAIDCCDQCPSCQKIDNETHADVFWVRPESKSRVIRVNLVTRREDSPARVLLEVVNLTPTESAYKAAVIVAADRLNEAAANAFLKTLEEPPPGSILILLTTEPERVLETVRSRCLRLNFGGEAGRLLNAEQSQWLGRFSELAATGQKTLLGRYRLMDLVVRRLNAMKEGIEGVLKARSPLERYDEVEKDLREKWEEELSAAVEAEYRRQRAELLLTLQWWLRDVWLTTLAHERKQIPGSRSKPGFGETRGANGSSLELLTFPNLAGPGQVAQRISAREAMENLRVAEQLQRWLHTNVQEALAVEVGFLKFKL